MRLYHQDIQVCIEHGAVAASRQVSVTALRRAGSNTRIGRITLIFFFLKICVVFDDFGNCVFIDTDRIV